MFLFFRLSYIKLSNVSHVRLSYDRSEHIEAQRLDIALVGFAKGAAWYAYVYDV